MSSTSSRARERSTWRKNAVPRPAPASTGNQAGDVHHPQFTVDFLVLNRADHRVQRGKGICGRARIGVSSCAKQVDLPALGKPIKPISAIIFRSKRSCLSSPGAPVVCSRGAWCVLVFNGNCPGRPGPPAPIAVRRRLPAGRPGWHPTPRRGFSVRRGRLIKSRPLRPCCCPGPGSPSPALQELEIQGYRSQRCGRPRQKHARPVRHRRRRDRRAAQIFAAETGATIAARASDSARRQ